MDLEPDQRANAAASANFVRPRAQIELGAGLGIGEPIDTIPRQDLLPLGAP